jgi:hypothetical protein
MINLKENFLQTLMMLIARPGNVYFRKEEFEGTQISYL